MPPKLHIPLHHLLEACRSRAQQSQARDTLATMLARPLCHVLAHSGAWVLAGSDLREWLATINCQHMADALIRDGFDTVSCPPPRPCLALLLCQIHVSCIVHRLPAAARRLLRLVEAHRIMP